MLQPIALFCSDTHLQPRVWTQYPDMAGDTYVAFDAVIALANAHDVPVFCAGDLFDKVRCDTNSLDRFSAAVGKLRNPFYYIQGNHDITDPPWPQVCSRSTHLHKQVVNLPCRTGRNWRIAGLDYQRSDQLPSAIDALYADNTDIDVLVMHQAWDEIQRVGSTQGSILSLLGGRRLSLLVTGDYHKRMTFPLADLEQFTTVHSPGSTCMQAIDEDADKYVTLLCVEYGDASVPRLVLRDLRLADTRLCYRHTVRTEAELNSLLRDGIGAFSAACKPLMQVTYMDTIPDVLPRLLAGVGPKVYLFLKAVANVETSEVAVLAAEGVAKITIGHAIREMERDPDVLQLAFAVEKATDVAAVLASERQKFVTEWVSKNAVV